MVIKFLFLASRAKDTLADWLTSSGPRITEVLCFRPGLREVFDSAHKLDVSQLQEPPHQHPSKAASSVFAHEAPLPTSEVHK